MGTKAREIRLKSRPVGLPEASNFDLVTVDLPDPGPGEVLVRNTYMSVDPYMRGRMYDRPSYVPPFQLGEVLQGGAVGRIEKSNNPDFKVGDLVESMNGWREAFVSTPAPLTRLPNAGVPPQAYLGVLGMPGMTAYTSFHRIGDPKPGNVVFVSGAGGAVGAAVCQIAKIRECTVVASAGTEEKINWLKSVGVDATVNYKTAPNLLEAVRAAAPKGIDIYFDNVGGEQLDAAILNMRPRGRIVVSGQIAEYNEASPRGIRHTTPFITQRLKMEGLVVYDYAPKFNEARTQMAHWIRHRKLSFKEEIVDGLENAPAAFRDLFTGETFGRRLVRVAHP